MSGIGTELNKWKVKSQKKILAKIQALEARKAELSGEMEAIEDGLETFRSLVKSDPKEADADASETE